MPETRPNVLFLFSDQHSYRHLGRRADPNEPAHTPTLDGLAETGTAFETAYCQSPLCTPSRISLLTGREVRAAGGWENGSQIREGLPTLPGVFSAAGYETCLLGKLHIDGDRQFYGFDHRPYGDLTGGGGHQGDPLFESRVLGSKRALAPPEMDIHEQIIQHGGISAKLREVGITDIPESLLQEQTVVTESLAWLREHVHGSDAPWFLCASFSRPHFPQTAPRRHLERYWPDDVPAPAVDETDAVWDDGLSHGIRALHEAEDLDPDQIRKARAAYFACVDYLDELLGEFIALLDRAGFLEDTIVVYTSDHGEMNGEHGLWGKVTWHEPSVRVPLMIETPSHRRSDGGGADIEAPVSLADLFPTLCGLTGVAPPSDLDGVDLTASIREGVEPDRGPVVCDYLAWTALGPAGNYRLVREGDFKYVEFGDGATLLFDVSSDPWERTPIEDPSGESAAARDRLAAFVAETMDFEAAAEQRTIDGADAESRALALPPGHGSGNAYLMPDGRIVDADTPLYQPHVLTRNPSVAFADWPGE